MKKSELFDALIDKVCEICEVKREAVIGGSKKQSVVDARILAVQYLKRIGLSTDDIALCVLREMSGDSLYDPDTPTLKKKAKSVDKMFNSYSARCLESRMFCLMSTDIKQFCSEQYEDIYLSWMREFSAN